MSSAPGYSQSSATRRTATSMLKHGASHLTDTVASGASRHVKARHIRNKRLMDACWQWALPALKASSGAWAYYHAHNPGPNTGKTARRKLANKLVGILHGRLKHRVHYDQAMAFKDWLPETEDEI